MNLNKQQALGLFAYCNAKGMALTGDLTVTEQRGDGEIWISATTISGEEVVVLPRTGGWRVEATALSTAQAIVEPVEAFAWSDPDDIAGLQSLDKGIGG